MTIQDRDHDLLDLDETVGVRRWRDPKRFLWLLGLVIPGLVGGAWLLVWATGVRALWWTGPIVVFGVIPTLDAVIGSDSENPPDSVLAWLEDDPFYRWVLYLYLPCQYMSLVLACWLWSGGGWLAMDHVDKLALMVTTGTVGGVAINAAHELGHKREHAEKWLSKVALAQTCYGHFFVEHNRGHHVWVATEKDSASSQMGQSLYSFIPRSVTGGLRSAWNIERTRLARTGATPWTLKNDVLSAWLISIGLFVVLTGWFGTAVAPWLAGQAIVGFCLLEIVNYLEHYGLRRQQSPSGRYERVRAAHSWNSNTIVANIFLFHLQRHSDHHAHPLRRYQALRHTEEAPQLPYGYGTMLLLALCPPLWRHVMDHRVLAHYNNDIRLVARKKGWKETFFDRQLVRISQLPRWH